LEPLISEYLNWKKKTVIIATVIGKAKYIKNSNTSSMIQVHQFIWVGMKGTIDDILQGSKRNSDILHGITF
jgi:hypothetical protein